MVTPNSDNNGGEHAAIAVPSIEGLSLLDAALALADQGFFLLLVATGKNPGSLAGRGWPAKSTCDPDTIRSWCAAHPDAGIAIHTGRSGVVALDLDVDVIPDELAWLRKGAFQSSRGGRGRRGHYVFATTETFVSGKLKLADGTVVGEVRSGNTVIVSAPSQHAKRDAGGEYRWIATGVVPGLPDEARAYVTTKAGGGSTGERVPVRSNAELDAWYDDHTEQREPWRREAFRHKYLEYLASGMKHHVAMMKVLGWAAREVEPGFVSATVFDDLYDDWQLNGPTERTPSSTEFGNMVVRAINDVGKESTDDLRNRGHREFGTDHRDYAGTFDGFEFTVESNAKRVGFDGSPPRNAALDLRRLRTEPSTPVAWLLPDVLARNSYVSLSAAPGTGKSILARGIAVDASLGRSHTDPTENMEPAKVIYLDAENGQDWWRDGLDAMGAPLDLPNLAVVAFPDLGGLDTARGAHEFLSLIDDLRDQLGGVDLIVLDTVSRFIDGGENDADTWTQFYRRAIQPLRDQQIAVLRLDHLGKDADKGPRGSSHKLSDVDADYRMTAAKPGSDDVTLTLGKRRRQHFTDRVRLRRRDDPLRHEPATNTLSLSVTLGSGQVVPANTHVAALVAELDALNIPIPNIGRDKAKTAYVAAGGSIRASNDVWADALKFRRERANHAVNNGGQPT